ncbi:MAG: XRE family transcriptional regulator [Candidatus Omnitrophota bacterium]
MNLIGVNIKRSREEKDITLREFAKRLGVSASFISQVETGKASPSLSTLKAIADALQTTVGSLIGENERHDPSPIVREEDRRSLKNISEGMRMYLLTSPDPNKQMEPILFKLEKNASSGDALYKHFGQEFVLVLKGSLEIVLNDTRYVLKQGDSMYFNSSVPHFFRNLHSAATEALWVVTPPTF